MSTTYRIAEVAHRSGFTPATLRYYEDLGLLAPARTGAGYRLYDEAALERLRFIARAKQLGCSLQEIAELTRAWDGGRCAPVQARLRQSVEARLADAHRQIAELTSLAAELQRAARVLSAEPADGPCSDTCGCVTDPGAVAVPLVAKAEVSPAGADDDEVPVVCTLEAGEMPGRVADWTALLAGTPEQTQGVVARRDLPDGGVRLELGPNTDVGDLARLAAAEQACCRFFRFDLTIDDRGVGLEVHAPPAGLPVVTALFGAAG